MTEADGGPLAAVVTGANVHDSLLLQDALEAVVVEPPDPREHGQHLCLVPFPVRHGRVSHVAHPAFLC